MHEKLTQLFVGILRSRIAFRRRYYIDPPGMIYLSIPDAQGLYDAAHERGAPHQARHGDVGWLGGRPYTVSEDIPPHTAYVGERITV